MLDTERRHIAKCMLSACFITFNECKSVEIAKKT